MSRKTWAAGMVIPLAAAVAVSTAPVATGVVVAPQAPNASTALPRAHRVAFALTMTRTGGIAGFQDLLVVAGTGMVAVTRRGQKAPACRLTPVALRQVRAAAGAVPWARITPDAGQARFPDDMVVMVKSRLGGPARVEDPRLGASGKVFQSLVSDVLVDPAASSMCKAA